MKLCDKCKTWRPEGTLVKVSIKEVNGTICDPEQYGAECEARLPQPGTKRARTGSSYANMESALDAVPYGFGLVYSHTVERVRIQPRGRAYWWAVHIQVCGITRCTETCARLAVRTWRLAVCYVEASCPLR